MLNKRDMRGKLKYLVRWKRYTVEENTWKGLENLENVINLVEKFEKEIKKEKIRRVQMRKKKGKKRILNLEAKVFKRSELSEKHMVKILFEWNNRKFEDEYLKKLERKLGKMKMERVASFFRGGILRGMYYYNILEYL